MKILQLLSEGKFIKSMYAYHATDTDNFRSILKHGLIPNKQERGYGSDEASDIGYSLSALSGVYFSAKAKDANFISKNLDGNRAIIVVCKVQRGNAELDEDRLGSELIDERKLNNQIYVIIRKANPDEMAELEEKDFEDADQTLTRELDEFVNEYTQNIIKNKLTQYDPKLIANVEPALREYIQALTNFSVSANIYSHFDESSVKSTQNILTQKLKVLLKDDTFNNSFKIDRVIGFSGANRIVGFYNPDTRLGWGDIGDFDSYSYAISDKHPLSILSK